MATFQERDGESFFSTITKKILRICQVEPNTNYPSNRCKRNVSFFECGADTELPIPLFDSTIASNQAGSITARMRARKSKARNKRSISKARKKVLFLIIGSIAGKEFARTEGIWNGNGGVGIKALCGELREYAADGVCGKAKPTVFLRYFHGEKFIVTHVIPCLLGEVFFDNDIVVIKNRTEVVHLIVKEGLFLLGKFGIVCINQVLKGRATREDISVETDGATAKSNLLCLADGG
mmetsp:Transcript_1340/g.1925  ORF Transcript_1340/g.1925 Transcript_1340/m.1925 type:complete len:236 (-) Transcript_1340:382-1089(-)